MSVVQAASTIGTLVRGRGVDLGDFLPDPKNSRLIYRAYADNDFLRDDKREIRHLSFNETGKELVQRYPGELYVMGTEANIRKAMIDGTYKDGVKVPPPPELLIGRNADGEMVRPENNVFVLSRKSAAFAKMMTAIDSRSAGWCVTSSENSVHSEWVRIVDLYDRDQSWVEKVQIKLAVAPVRFFKAAAPQPRPV